MSAKPPLDVRVTNSFSRLSEASRQLNIASDELGKSISEIDSALKNLNLGVTAWVEFGGNDGTPQESWYVTDQIGYSKVGPNWGISIRKITGDYQRPDEEDVDTWHFNDAPRILRIESIRALPELLDSLSKEAIKFTTEIQAKLGEVKTVAEAVKSATNPNAKPRIAIRSITPAKSEISTDSVDPSLDQLKAEILAALQNAGHSSAAGLLKMARWKHDSSGLHIEVTGISSKMLAMTVNSAAEKILRTELQSLGLSGRFSVVTIPILESNSVPDKPEGK